LPGLEYSTAEHDDDYQCNANHCIKHGIIQPLAAIW